MQPAYTQSAPFTLAGVSTDVTTLRVSLSYNSASTPPTTITCSNDAGTSFFPC